MKKYIALAAFLVSLFVSSGSAQVIFSDLHGSYSSIDSGWVVLPGVVHDSIVADTASAGNNALKISTISNDFYPADSGLQAFNTTGLMHSVSASGMWTVDTSIGVKAGDFGSFPAITDGAVTPYFRSKLDILAGGHDISVVLGNHYYQVNSGDLPQRLVFSIFVDGTDTFNAIGWSPTSADLISQAQHYDPTRLLWQTMQVSGNSSTGDVHFALEGFDLSVFDLNLGANLDLSSISLSNVNNGDSFDSYWKDVTVTNQALPSVGAVPEPSTYGLVGALALLGLVGYRRFGQKKTV